MQYLWSEFAKSDTFSLVWGTSASVDKWRVEPVHIIVLIIDEEAFAYSHVAISISVAVEPIILNWEALL